MTEQSKEPRPSAAADCSAAVALHAVIRRRLELMDELDRDEANVLRRLGWEAKCDVPGSYWLWQKKLPDGRVVMVYRSMALSIEQAMADADVGEDDELL